MSPETSQQFTIKYRPNIWSEVRGHKKIVRELKIRSKDKDFPKVLLFSGCSGIGKDTLAFLVAKTINCKNPILKKDEDGIEYYDPCNECMNCRSVNDQDWRGDIEFIDCSSATKDDVVNLRNTSQVSTMWGGHKRIFIIDEFQAMVNATTKQAFLTLLENPSDNAVFIFTTMEIGKVPVAIKSGRAQHYQLAPLSLEDLSNIIFDIVEKDKRVKVDEVFFDDEKGSMKNLLEMAEGSARNLLSMFERIVHGKLFLSEDLKDVFSAPPQAKLFDILKGILTKQKSVLVDLQSYPSLDEFFYMSYDTLTETLIYAFTKSTKAYWKENLYKNLIVSIPMSEIQNLMSLYNSMYGTILRGDAKPAFILGTLLEYILKDNGKLVEQVEVPVQIVNNNSSRRIIKE